MTTRRNPRSLGWSDTCDCNRFRAFFCSRPSTRRAISSPGVRANAAPRVCGGLCNPSSPRRGTH
eukprot:9489942-Pyramimonas_sp.AAC.1